jgi:hypothetical protein
MIRKGGWFFVALGVVGCNAILDNKPGVLLESDTPATDVGNDGGGTRPPSIPDAGQPDTAGCNEGQFNCNGACVSLTDPRYGCGSPTCTPCATPNASAACQGRACVIAACNQGYADCNQDPADGCEGDLSRPQTCGACNAVCPPAAPMCAPAGGSFQCGAGCPPAAPLLCGLECVDPQTSPNHCGVCNNKCPEVANATASCTAGTCGFTCQPNYKKCPDKCALPNDPAACGPNCVVCPAPTNAQATCAMDACAFTCNMGFGNCNLNAADGCEANLATDPLNCNACGNACPANHTCNAGVCQPPPPPPPPP